MHIPDGVLSDQAMVATNVIAAGVVVFGLSRTDYERVPRVGVLASVFFVASFIHVNIGPSSVHLLLNGLLGLVLGWAAFPALAAALLLQAVLLGYGGMTSLGANILNMAVPAGVCYGLFARPVCRSHGTKTAFLWGALTGGTSVLLSCLLMAAVLHISSAQNYGKAIKVLLILHVPVMVVEAAVVGAAIAFLHKVRPELLSAPVKEQRRPVPG